jgi:hypothetical protein
MMDEGWEQNNTGAEGCMQESTESMTWNIKNRKQ